MMNYINHDSLNFLTLEFFFKRNFLSPALKGGKFLTDPYKKNILNDEILKL